MLRKNHKSIIYVNYSPYENSGNILDYLLENYNFVFLFSIGFHNLGKNRRFNKLTIYKNGKEIHEISLYHMHVPRKFVFFLVPIRSSINFFQILWQSILLKKQYGKVDTYFSVNAFAAFLGLVLKRIGIVSKTIFWVWDYYPIVHPNKIVTIMRWQYWQFDRLSSRSDRVVFLNNRMKKQWINKNVISKSTKYPIVPIGTDSMKVAKVNRRKDIRLGFIGVLKKSQGLDLIFDAEKILIKKFPKIRIDIVGSGPDEEYFKKRAKKSKLNIIFHGLVEEKVFEKILSRCTIGIAPYVPDPSNVSFYGDPGKVKRYMSFGLPSIITDVFEFSKKLQKSGSGVVIDYFSPKKFVDAIDKILSNHNTYVKNVKQLNKKYHYKKIYSKIFN